MPVGGYEENSLNPRVVYDILSEDGGGAGRGRDDAAEEAEKAVGRGERKGGVGRRRKLAPLLLLSTLSGPFLSALGDELNGEGRREGARGARWNGEPPPSSRCTVGKRITTPRCAMPRSA